MNWLIFSLTAYLVLALEKGFRALWGIPDETGVTPSLTLILMVFIGLSAAPMSVAWAALILGVLVDLQPTTGAIAILGPAAIGYLVGAYAVVQLRNLLFRESILTLAIMVFAVGLFVNLTEVAIYSFRGLSFLAADPMPEWSAFDELARRFVALLYSAVVALPMGWLLFKLQPLWGFGPAARAERVY